MDIASENVSVKIVYFCSFHRKTLRITDSSHSNLDMIKSIIRTVSKKSPFHFTDQEEKSVCLRCRLPHN